MDAGRNRSMSKSSANFLQALIAVVAGNVAYFVLEKYLPVSARHSAFRFDWGTVVDFWFCLVAFGIVKTVAGWREKARVGGK